MMPMQPQLSRESAWIVVMRQLMATWWVARRQCSVCQGIEPIHQVYVLGLGLCSIQPADLAQASHLVRAEHGQ